MFGRNKTPKRRAASTRTPRRQRVATWWRELSDDRRGAYKRIAAWSAGVVVLCAAVVPLLCAMERRVLDTTGAAGHTVVRLKLVNCPPWMPASLRERISASLTPPSQATYDTHLAQRICRKALRNPWVRSVARAQRGPGQKPGETLIELDAKYRKAVARIRTRLGEFAYVDDQGVVLPSREVPRWVAQVRLSDGSTRQACFIDPNNVPPGVHAQAIHYFTINGVRARPAPPGETWPGGDVQAGLRLVKLLSGRPYANQITVVDVRNHGGISRDSPQLCLYAQVDHGHLTKLVFGRFPVRGGDHVVSPRRKLSNLDGYVRVNDGRLAGVDAGVDLRHDNIHIRTY